jgi:hypothetical protein
VLGLDVAQPVDISGRSQRLVKPGPHALVHRQHHAHGLGDDQDVAEDDRRVDPEPVHGLERHLDGQLGGPDHGEKVGALAHGPVLGQIAPRLAHHPHRWPLDGLTPAGPKKEIVHGLRTGSAGGEQRADGRGQRLGGRT